MPTQQSPEWTTSLDEKQFEQLLSTGSANRSVSISAEGTTTVLTRQATGNTVSYTHLTLPTTSRV